MMSTAARISKRLAFLLALAGFLGWLVLADSPLFQRDIALSESVSPRRPDAIPGAGESTLPPASDSAFLPDPDHDREPRMLATTLANPFTTSDAPVGGTSASRTPVPAARPTPPAPPMNATAAANAARAPALPFTAVGAISGASVTDGKLVAFISQRETLMLVRAGDSIGTSYRVESVTPERVEFMYLPLMQRQTLNLAP